MDKLAAIVYATGVTWGVSLFGRTVLERAVRSALAAGAEPCILLCPEPPPERLLRDPRVRWTRNEEEARGWAGKEFLFVESEALYDPRILRWVMESLPEPGRARTVRIEGRPVLSKVHIGPIASDRSPSFPESVPRNWLTPVRTRAELDRGRDWLLRQLAEDYQGFASFYLERPFSITLVRILVHLPFPSAWMTFVGLGVGLGAAWMLSQPLWGLQVGGSFLVWVHAVLGACALGLSRLKLEESRWGQDLAFWSQSFALAVIIVGIGWGLGQGGTNRLPLGLAGAAALFSLAAAALLAWSGTQAWAGPAPPAGPSPQPGGEEIGERERTALHLARLRDLGARRDYIYFMIPAALLQKLLWFLWAAAVGTGLYLGILWFVCWRALRLAESN